MTTPLRSVRRIDHPHPTIHLRYPALTGVLLDACILLQLCCLAPSAGAVEETRIDGILHVQNGETPTGGVHTMEFEELWRIGPDDDVLFGAIGRVLMGPDGNIYLLDRQLCEVQVFSPQGEFLRTLSREGEGPGETRRPRDILFLPDGTLGIAQVFPGRIIKVGLDGTPAGSIHAGGQAPAEGGFTALFTARAWNDQILVCAEQSDPSEGRLLRTRYMARIDAEGNEVTRLLETSIERDLARFVWDEEEDYFIHRGGLAIGTDGRVFAATQRDAYAIRAYNPDGTVERVIEREFTSRQRTPQEKIEANGSMRMLIDDREIEKNISEYDPYIPWMHVDEENNLWVLNNRSGYDEPDGIFHTYDVFDAEGRLTHQVAAACPGDAQQDGLFLFGPDRAVLVRGMVGGLLSMIGATGQDADPDADEEAVELEVIFYRVHMASAD